MGKREDWISYFKSVNGREPTAAEIEAGKAEWGDSPADSATTAKQIVGYDTQTGAPIYADQTTAPTLSIGLLRQKRRLENWRWLAPSDCPNRWADSVVSRLQPVARDWVARYRRAYGDV